MNTVKIDDVKELAAQNAALVSLMEKIHKMLKPYKGQDNFHGQLFKVMDLELFRAKNVRFLHGLPNITVTVRAEKFTRRESKPEGAYLSR
jgi:hypothetical protein